jgi:two-component system sensor histidine kinase KdpD
MSARRSWSGLGAGLGGLAVLTGLLVPARHDVALAGVVLIYLVPVVAAAAVGGVRPALVTAVSADLLVNYLFVPPYHTLVVESGEHVIVLVVYVLVAAAVSLGVDLAARDRARAARRELEASLLAAASTEPVAEESLTRLLEQVRTTFGMSAVAMLESGPEGEHEVAGVGGVGNGRPALSAAAGHGLRLVAWGPELFAEDRRTLTRLANAAARTLEAQRLAHQAAEGREVAEMDRVRAALLAAVGHDLRTPLAGIKAAASSLRHPDLELTASGRAELLATIEESTDRLTALVDNLLAMSRLQAGALSVHLEPVALDAIVAHAVLHTDLTPAPVMSELGPTGHAEVRVDIPDDLPLVQADPGLLERVVANLLTNALAASPPAGTIRLHGHTAASGVVLHVVDHGPGVPEEQWDRIFAPFQRLHDRSAGAGLGLGLAIARGFTEAMGATLTPSRTPGGGLTMTVTLPIARTGPHPDHATVRESA